MEIGIDKICDKTHFEISCVTYGIGQTTRYIQILWKHKFDTFYRNIAATWIVMRGNGDGFHPPRIFCSIRSKFRKKAAIKNVSGLIYRRP